MDIQDFLMYNLHFQFGEDLEFTKSINYLQQKVEKKKKKRNEWKKMLITK